MENKSWFRYGIWGIGILFICFQIYTALFGLLPGVNQRVVHLGFVLALGAILEMEKIGKANRKGGWIFQALLGIFFLIAVITTVYGYVVGNTLLSDRAGVYNQTDIIMGVITILLVLLLTWRVLGPALPILALLFIAYAKWGNLIPGYFGNRGYSLSRIASQLYLGYEGIYGTAIAAVSSYIALFIIFGGLLGAIGSTKVFSDLSFSLVGHVRGGPAKVAVVASSLFGTMSGSVTANVVGTGSFTIPLMKSTGYSAPFAGAVEATASCGGQIMPPVMGVAAFIIAEYLGVPYSEVLKAALLPAILYFLGVFLAVDFHAGRERLTGVKREELPKFGQTFRKGWLCLLPLVILIYFLGVAKTTAARGALIGNLSCLIIGVLLLRKDCIRPILESFVDSAKSLVPVALGTATAGIVIGIFSLTGLGFKLSSALIQLSGGNVFILLLLTMVSALILGMGLPTVAAYILLATLIVPALVEMGIEPMAAHLFVFYFGVISNITPPVCLGVYAASGIAKSEPMATAIQAIKIAMPGFIVPYVFAFNPGLIMINTTIGGCLYSFFIVFVGVIALSMGVFGYCVGPIEPWKRALFIVGGALMVYTSILTDVIGLAIVVILVGVEIAKKKRQKAAEPREGAVQ
ncbi:TRAP transporter permease [Hominifimenecus sp. rT4P-3]|uniref:TRAP transporter permease n=1 Tax=Hominifimenecus sp. rT4P-3 TaxID=3242979 RepID=UPI003DA64505